MKRRRWSSNIVIDDDGTIIISVDGYGAIAGIGWNEETGEPEVVAWPGGNGGENGENVTTEIHESISHD